jgi:hypothetical protein
MENRVSDQTGLIASIKDRLHVDALLEKIRASRETLIDVALYGGIGFLSGFLIRRYSSYVATAIIVGAGLILLNQFDIISLSINWSRVHSFLGIEQYMLEGQNMFSMAWEWTKGNVVIAVSFLIGFLIGIRIGS